jgi:endonuclease/exonuclease/phosphatase family metal-dependent hydrolase
MRFRLKIWFFACLAFASSAGLWPSGANAGTLRVATYNIEADTTTADSTPSADLFQVIEGIGEESIAGDVQPVDIVALQETYSNSRTVAPIVSNLNSYYGGTAIYAQSSVQGTEEGNNPFIGNGPNAIVYNTTTLQLLSSVGIGTPLGAANGEYRQVMRYEFEPVGGNASDIFYVYDSHMKSSASGTAFADETARAEEAAIIRADETTLVTASNPNPSVLYMGDFNLSGSALITSGSQSVSAYQTLTAPGPGQGVDPNNTNPQNNNETWDKNAAYAYEMTETAIKLQYRDDIQFMTQNVYGDSGPGLSYVQGSLHSFGNNGSVGVNGNVSSGTNTALEDLEPDAPISRATILSDLTTASDHLPVVADYYFAVPEPTTLASFGIGLALLLIVAARRLYYRQANLRPVSCS